MGTIRSKALSLIHRAARAYTAGPSLHHARTLCEQFGGNGVASTICYWNADTDQPDRIIGSYNDILGIVPDLGADCYLSIKAPAIGYDMALLKTVLERARTAGAAVHFDALAPETADPTFDMIAKARKLYPRIGCTLPGRWRRSLRDVDQAVEMGLRVRVVKGEWPEAVPDDADPRKGFLNVIDRLGAQRANHVAVATHNPDLAREALSRLRTTGTSCELELLYGLPSEPLLDVARALGVPARMYVPYGNSRLPYRLRAGIWNPRILAWFLRDLLRSTTWARTFYPAPPEQGWLRAP